jgi:transposase
MVYNPLSEEAMTKTRKRYIQEFKTEAVRLLESGGKSASELEHELGIGKGNLWRWKREFGMDHEPGRSGTSGRAHEQQRIRELERENEILRQERDILKKPSPSSRDQSHEVPVH